MSATTKTLGIDQLSIDERLRLIDEIRESIANARGHHTNGNGMPTHSAGPSPSSIDGSIKAAAHWLIDRLPDDATWDDLRYQAYTRQKIDRGLKESREGRTISHEEVCRRFGVSSE